MKELRTGLYPGGRLKNGAAILAAGETVDVTLVQKRLDEFTREHMAYTGAHGEVQAALTLLRERQPALEQRNRELNDLVDELAKRVALDGHTRTNPFAAYGAATPSAIMALRYGEKAQAIHQLVGMLQADPTLSAATQRTGKAAEDAARQMEAELIPVTKLQTRLRIARAARAAAGKRWDNALNALKIAARAAAADGAPGLYEALFGHLAHPKKKKAKEAQQQPATDQPAASAASPAASGNPSPAVTEP